MGTHHRLVLLGVLVATVLATSLPAAAQGTRRDATGNQESLNKMQALLRQANLERDAAKADAIKAQQEIEEHRRKLDAAKRELAAASKRGTASEEILERYKQTDAALRERIAQQSDKLQQIVDKYKELVASLREVESQRANLQTMVASQAKEIDKCVDSNVDLYRTGLDLLDAYEHKGVWAALKSAEPFTQIQRVKMENLMQDYRLRLGDATISRPIGHSVQ